MDTIDRIIGIKDVNNVDYFAAALILLLESKSTKYEIITIDDRQYYKSVGIEKNPRIDFLQKHFIRARTIVNEYRGSNKQVDTQEQDWDSSVVKCVSDIDEVIKGRCKYIDLLYKVGSEFDKSIDVSSEDIFAAGIIIELTYGTECCSKRNITSFMESQFPVAALIVNNLTFSKNNDTLGAKIPSKQKCLGTGNNI